MLVLGICVFFHVFSGFRRRDFALIAPSDQSDQSDWKFGFPEIESLESLWFFIYCLRILPGNLNPSLHSRCRGEYLAAVAP